MKISEERERERETDPPKLTWYCLGKLAASTLGVSWDCGIGGRFGVKVTPPRGQLVGVGEPGTSPGRKQTKTRYSKLGLSGQVPQSVGFAGLQQVVVFCRSTRTLAASVTGSCTVNT